MLSPADCHAGHRPAKSRRAMKLNPAKDLCLCGSGWVIDDCCTKDVRPRKNPPKTHFAHPKCYAAPLADCCDKITGEHFITEGVMKLIGEPITVGGLSWLKGRDQTLTTNALTAKILCKRCNSAIRNRRCRESLFQMYSIASEGQPPKRSDRGFQNPPVPRRNDRALDVENTLWTGRVTLGHRPDPDTH